MIERKDVMSKVVTIITPYARDQAALKAAGEKTRILEDLKVNSARFVDIVLKFEDEFKIEIDDGSAGKVKTLGDAADVISSKLN